MTAHLLKLENRAVLRLHGNDIRDFLQGLVTNDVAEVAPGKAVYAAMLTPQGKFLYDMIIVAEGNDLLLDVEAERSTALMQRLTMYKMRADVTITVEGSCVWALWGGDTETGTCYADPRHKALELRVISNSPPVSNTKTLDQSTYDKRRIRHGVPDGSLDIMTEKYFWLETNAEKLNGVSFTKGCYVGQELTARMKHRGTLKKSLTPIELSGPASMGDKIMTTEGKAAGDVRTVSGGLALAYFRLEYSDAGIVVNDKPASLKLTSE
ncbi:MAG: folate-binding protein YgfZ [Kordiimonadales bacterium]|nr:MAG: folate-binding protein YgfZ [Kordiimonadales bacterium]